MAVDLPGMAGQRLIDATPAFEPYRETTCDEFDGIHDSLEVKVVDASVRFTLTTVILTGPRVLYHFCDERYAKAEVPGNYSWWTHERPVVESVGATRSVPQEERESEFHSAMRGRLAVTVKWNEMRYIRALRIPPGYAIRVMTSLAASQPEDDGRRYAGGGVQYVLVLSSIMNDIRPSDPEPLVTFLAKSLARPI